MKSIPTLKIKLEREEKNKLDDAAEVIKEIVELLKSNKENGWTAYQENIDIYDAFWAIYNLCIMALNQWQLKKNGASRILQRKLATIK